MISASMIYFPLAGQSYAFKKAIYCCFNAVTRWARILFIFFDFGRLLPQWIEPQDLGHSCKGPWQEGFWLHRSTGRGGQWAPSSRIWGVHKKTHIAFEHDKDRICLPMFFILIVLTQSQRADTRTAPIPDQRFGAICTKVLTRKKELQFKYHRGRTPAKFQRKMLIYMDSTPQRGLDLVPYSELVEERKKKAGNLRTTLDTRGRKSGALERL